MKRKWHHQITKENAKQLTDSVFLIGAIQHSNLMTASVLYKESTNSTGSTAYLATLHDT
jgi:hypothetical protein